MDIQELWKPIKDFEDLYEVSNMGRVRRIGKPPRIPQNNGNGYKVVYLYRNSKHKKAYVHRLVAEAFIPNPDNKPYVNHIDETRDNNVASNLEWCTQKENCNHGTAPKKCRDGIVKYWKENPYHNCKLVRCVETGIVYRGIVNACKATGAINANVRKCITGERHTAGGYHWELVEE